MKTPVQRNQCIIMIITYLRNCIIIRFVLPLVNQLVFGWCPLIACLSSVHKFMEQWIKYIPNQFFLFPARLILGNGHSPTLRLYICVPRNKGIETSIVASTYLFHELLSHQIKKWAIRLKYEGRCKRKTYQRCCLVLMRKKKMLLLLFVCFNNFTPRQ